MAIRYEREGDTIEVHVFNPPAEKYADSQDFNRFGINHIALHVDGPRDQFVKELSEKVQYLEIRRFHDPSGWDNIFIRDYEGNWIELREAL